MRPFLRMFTSNAQIIEYGVRYSKIVFLFATALSWQLVFEKTFQAVGRMVASMTCMMTGCIINIVLDPVMIFGIGPCPKLGIEGAAWQQEWAGSRCLVISDSLHCEASSG